MYEKRKHLDAILEAIAEGETLLQENTPNPEVALHVIRAVQKWQPKSGVPDASGHTVPMNDRILIQKEALSQEG